MATDRVKLVYQLMVFLLFILTMVGCYPKTGVLKEEVLLSKKLFYEASMTDITRIKEVGLCPPSGSEIAIFGQLSMHIVDRLGTLKRKVKFEWKYGILSPDIIVKNCSHFDIIASGSFSAGILDQYGKAVWFYKPDDTFSINDAATGDLNRDGELEFYVATDEGLHQLNYAGEKIWEKGESAWRVKVLDLGKNEMPLVVTRLSYKNLLQFRDYEGNLIREIKPEVKIRDLELCDWPSPGHFLTRGGNTIYILDSNGKVVFKHKLGNFFDLTEIFEIRGVSVKLFKDQKDYFAVVLRLRAGSDRSILCIFSPDGRLVYREVLHCTTGITAIQLSSKSETLLVGDGPGKVYSYLPMK